MMRGHKFFFQWLKGPVGIRVTEADICSVLDVTRKHVRYITPPCAVKYPPYLLKCVGQNSWQCDWNTPYAARKDCDWPANHILSGVSHFRFYSIIAPFLKGRDRSEWRILKKEKKKTQERIMIIININKPAISTSTPTDSFVAPPTVLAENPLATRAILKEP